MFRSGRDVAERVSPITVEQIQPNGVDLRLETVFEPRERGRIGRDGKEIGARAPVPPTGEDPATFELEPGAYIVRYIERIRIPEDHVGFVLPRSSLLRNGSMLDTAVWDAGYDGRGEGLLEVHHPIAIEREARIAQLVLAGAAASGTYDGTYQGEGVE